MPIEITKFDPDPTDRSIPTSESVGEDKQYNLVLDPDEKRQLVIVQDYYRAPNLKHAVRLMLGDVVHLIENNQWGEIEREIRNVLLKGGG